MTVAPSDDTSWARTDEMPLAERFNGVRWTVLPTSQPAGGKGGELDGVDCVTGPRCVAVGDYLNRAERTVPLTERYS